MTCHFLRLSLVMIFPRVADQAKIAPLKGTMGQVPNQEELANIQNCSISSQLLKYLGLPLGAPFKSKDIWDGAVEKWIKDWLVGRRFICLEVAV